MGDERYRRAYEKIRDAGDRARALLALTDDDVVQALAHASREKDALLANVLATESLNRMRRSRTAFNHLGEGLIAVDLDGRITSVNPTACRLLGAKPEELVGEDFADALRPRDERDRPLAMKDTAIMRALAKGGVVETEEWFTRRDGALFPVGVIAAPITQEGEIHGAVATFLDISQRREVEARRAAVIEASLDAIVTIDGEGYIREFNAAAERIFGHDRRLVIGQRLANVIIPPEHRGSHLAGVHRVASGGPSRILGRRMRLPALRADGSTIQVELTITQLPGEPVRFTGFIRDLTDEAAARADARAAQERYEQIVKRSPLSTQIFTPQGKTLATNPAWERLWGVTLAQLGDYNLLQDPQLEKKGIAAYLRRAVAGETVYIPPVLYDPAEGNIPLGRARYVEAHAYPLLDAQGKVSAVVLIHDDVTDRVLAGQRSALAQTQAQLVIENVKGFAICMLDAGGRVALWNTGSARMNGYSADEIIGTHVRAFHTPEAQARQGPELALQIAVETGAHESEGWLVRKGGERYWASTTLTAIREDGRLVGFAKIVRDLTERKMAEDRAREQERMYRDLVENSPEPMGVHAAGKLLFINAAGARLLGAREPAEIVGRDVTSFVAPESRNLVVARMKAIMNAEVPLPPAEETLIRTDGSKIHVETVAFPVVYGGTPAVQLILRDISHRKLAEENLRRFNAELEARVDERTRQLQEALRDLETFTNSASHDLRAPLRGAITLADDLVKSLRRGETGAAEELASLIKAESEKAARLVHDLLAFAKSGQHELDPHEVDVTKLAAEIAEEISRQHPARRASWRIQPDMNARADPSLLRIALTNLLSNAAKYSSKTDEPRVEITQERDGEGVTIVVADNGVGFPPSEAHRLFGPFHRLSTAQDFEGTGLGLVTASRITRRHGGRISATSEPGKGAVFRLWLPREAKLRP